MYLEHIIGLIQSLKFSEENFAFLLNYDKFGLNKNLGINIFSKENSTVVSDQTTTRIFFSYIIEKYIMYANGNTIFSQELIVNLFNLFLEMDTKLPTGSLSNTSNRLLAYQREQLDLQEDFALSFIRFFDMYGINTEVNKIFLKNKKITLSKYLYICVVLSINIIEKKREVFTSYDIDIQSTLIKQEELEIALKYMSITRKEFQEKYSIFRKNYKEDEEYIDRVVPKISFFYPFLKYGNTYQLISYTALTEFMKMSSTYRMMTEEFTGISFKSEKAGPLFEKYVLNKVKEYNDNNKINGKVSGNESYKEKGEKKAPDVILETAEYVVFIECKSNPFSIELFHTLDNRCLMKYKEAIENSLKNINRYKKHINSNKPSIQILVFFEHNQIYYDTLVQDVYPLTQDQSIFILSIESLELLLSLYHESLSKFFDHFLENKKIKPTNIHAFLPTQLKMSLDDYKKKEFLLRGILLELVIRNEEYENF